MKFNILKTLVPVTAIAVCGAMSSCVNDLTFKSASETDDPNINQPFDANQMYTKCYASLEMEGNDGGADFSIDDGGKSCLMRNIYNFECLGTDESVCWWTDGGLINMCYNQCSPGDQVIRFLYLRCMSNITYCNHYLNDSQCQDLGDVKYAEVRWIRAYNYYVLANEFGNIPFLEKISPDAAPQKSRAFMYNWLIDEFSACIPDLLTNGPVKDTDKEHYGRVTQAAAYLMLSRLYLNCKVWNKDNPEFTDANAKEAYQLAMDYSKKIIDAGYQLCTSTTTVKDKTDGITCTYTGYDKLFMADNGSSDAYQEAILPLLGDGDDTRSWGGFRFFIAAHSSGDSQLTVNDASSYCSDGWSGMRVTYQLLQKFTTDPTQWEGLTCKQIREKAGDDRALFWSGTDENGKVVHTAHVTTNESQTTSFNAGMVCNKFNNRRSDGEAPKHTDGWCDGDYFMLRAAEAYLNYAEAQLRYSGSNTTTGDATTYMKALRNRAHCKKEMSTFTLDDILDERAREFYCEGYRRTDLIRFGQYGGNSSTTNWEWRGGVYAGQAFAEYRNLFPLPTVDIEANKNLTQNPGYPTSNN